MTEILFVDDDEFWCRAAASAVTHDVRLVIARGRDEALACIANQRFDAAVIEVCRPRALGYDLVAPLREVSPAARVVLVSGWPTPDAEGRAFALDVAFRMKPYELRALLAYLLGDEPRPSRVAEPSLEYSRSLAASMTLAQTGRDASAASIELRLDRKTVRERSRRLGRRKSGPRRPSR
jgi:ActR/RegA family two-component response regulator